MSIRLLDRVKYILCDHPGDGGCEARRVAGGGAAHARWKARRDQWDHVPGWGDRCPDHRTMLPFRNRSVR